MNEIIRYFENSHYSVTVYYTGFYAVIISSFFDILFFPLNGGSGVTH